MCKMIGYLPSQLKAFKSEGKEIDHGVILRIFLANVTLVKLDDAPKGYVDFDKGTAKKFVLDPHLLLAA